MSSLGFGNAEEATLALWPRFGNANSTPVSPLTMTPRTSRGFEPTGEGCAGFYLPNRSPYSDSTSVPDKSKWDGGVVGVSSAERNQLGEVCSDE